MKVARGIRVGAWWDHYTVGSLASHGSRHSRLTTEAGVCVCCRSPSPLLATCGRGASSASLGTRRCATGLIAGQSKQSPREHGANNGLGFCT